MTVAAHLNSFYSAARIILWVEDVVTRDYLTKVWGDPPEVAFFIAGNTTAIRPAIEAAQREGVSHVFGLVDRDFGHTNITNWNLPATRVFYLSRHEIENYALDAAAIHGCSLNNRNRTLAQVQTELNRLAILQPAWLACRRVLTEMRQALQNDFPDHPKIVHIGTVSQAEQHIIASQWFARLAPVATTWTAPGHVQSQLQLAHTAYTAALANGTWAAEFSGKEIFGPLRSYVYQPPRAGSHYSDFAKAIGEWQFANNAVPADLVQLRGALRVKVGLPP